MGNADSPKHSMKGLFRRGFLGRGAPKDEPTTHLPSCCSDDELESRSVNTADKQPARWFSPGRKSRLRKRQDPVDPVEIDVEVMDTTEHDGIDARNRLGTWSYFKRNRAKPAQTRKDVPPERFVGSPDASPMHS